MARRRGSNPFGVLALVGVTVAAGAALGYYVIGGAHPNGSASDTPGVQEASAPPASVPAPMPTAHPLVHVHPNSDYTAPGAPRIHIVEDRTPTLASPGHRPMTTTAPDVTTATDIPTPDVEASQQGGSVAAPPATPDTPAPDPEAGQTGTPVAPPAPPRGQGGGLNTAPTPDPEAGQTGIAPTALTSQRAQYRIQAGSFGSAQDAQDYVNTLQGKGVDASVSPQRQGGQTVYKVQVGAYHDHDAAEQAASSFRRQGVPVTVAPITP